MRRSISSLFAFLVLASAFAASPQSRGAAAASATEANVLPITVEVWSDPRVEPSANLPAVSITLCIPGQPADAEHCQTIDHILVDTGAVGVRVLWEALNSKLKAGLTSERVQLRNTSGQQNSYTVAECLQYADSKVWGKVARADVWLGSEPNQHLADAQHATMPIQIFGTGAIPSPVPKMCANGRTATGVASFGNNGTIGIGSSLMDNSLLYYACDASNVCKIEADEFVDKDGKNRTTVRIDQSVRVPNPVYRMPQDNNGIVFELDPVANHKAAVGHGQLILGIGTRGNNGLRPDTQVMRLLDPSNGNYVPIRYNLVNVNPPEAIKGDATPEEGAPSLPYLTTGSVWDFDTGTNYLSLHIPSLRSSGEDKCFLYSFYCPVPTVDLALTFNDFDHATKIYNLSVARVQPGDWLKTAALDAATRVSKEDDRVLFGLPFFYGRRFYLANKLPRDAKVSTVVFDHETQNLAPGSEPLAEILPVASIADAAGKTLSAPFYGLSPQTPKFTLNWDVQKDAAGAVRKGYTMVGDTRYEDEGVYFTWRNDTLDPSIRAASSWGHGPALIEDQSIYDSEFPDVVYRQAPGRSAGAWFFERLFGSESRPKGERYRFKSEYIINDGVPDQDGYYDVPISYKR